MWAQICLRAWVREISGTPTSSCISGETLRGFMIPRSGFPEEGCERVAEVTLRTMRMVVGVRGRQPNRGDFENGVAMVRTVEERLAISLATHRVQGIERRGTVKRISVLSSIYIATLNPPESWLKILTPFSWNRVDFRSSIYIFFLAINVALFEENAIPKIS